MPWYIHILIYTAAVYLAICVIYFFLQERFIFVPTIPGDPFESMLATPTEEFLIDTPHRGKIHGLLLKVENPKGIIFYLHGNTGSLKRWQFMAEEVASYGFDVFVLDYRQYGQSHGRLRESYMHRDAEFCFDLIGPRYSNLPKIIYGRSLGSGFAVRLAERRRPDRLVLESPFYNMLDVARHYLPFLPLRLILRFRFRSDYYIRFVDCPIHIFHGTKDIVVPYSSALRLFRTAEKAGRDVHMTTIARGNHRNLNSFPLFREKMREFLLSESTKPEQPAAS